MRKSYGILVVLFIVAVAVLLFWSVRLIGKNKTVKPPEAVTTPPPVTAEDPVLGRADAPVTVIEFSDFQCPYCKTMDDILRRLITDQPQNVRIVWKDYPQESAHANALSAAQAARCAQVQGKFWEYHDLLFANQGLLSDTLYGQIATTLGLNLDAFRACITAPSPQVISRGVQEGNERGIDATPYLFVNSFQKSGTLEYSELQSLVIQALNASQK